MSDIKNKTILIMAGGTGGHVMPALAVAERLASEGFNIHWLGTRRGIEAYLVPQAGYGLSFIDIQGIRGKSWRSWLSAPIRIVKAFRQALRIIKARSPDLILSMGGYAAGPGALAGLFCRIPLIIHEQNAVPGTTNRILARFAKQILVSFPGVFAIYGSKVIYAGNPIRQALLGLPPPRERLTVNPNKKMRLLVLGGSQGAQCLNQLVPAAIALMPSGTTLTVVHQCGQDKVKETQAAYQKINIAVEICTFIEDMAEAYQEADVLIARAGALTVAEIAAIGIPSILIPFPYATDDHQTKNAKFLSDQGGAILLSQRDLTAEMLAQALEELFASSEKRLKMAEISRKLGKPLATSVVAEYCKEVSHG